MSANGGIYNWRRSPAQPNAQVHAFEPTPKIAARLRRTAVLNGLPGLCVHQKAVSNDDGYALLRRCGADVGGNEGMNYIVPEAGGNAAVGERVETTRLDTACRTLRADRIDLLKLDIQGGEAAALEGAEELLVARRVGFVFMELNWGAPSPARRHASGRPAGECGIPLRCAALAWTGSLTGDWLRRLSDVVARVPAIRRRVAQMIVDILACLASLAVLLQISRRRQPSLGLPLAYLASLLLIHVPGLRPPDRGQDAQRHGIRRDRHPIHGDRGLLLRRGRLDRPAHDTVAARGRPCQPARLRGLLA